MIFPGCLPFRAVVVLGFSLLAHAPVSGQSPPRFESVQTRTNGTVALRVTAEVGRRHRLETSGDLRTWAALATFAGAAAYDHLDTAPPSPSPGARFYRVRTLEDGAVLTGDHLGTSEGDAVFHPVNHACLLFQWNGLTIYNDPVGGAAPYAEFPRADLILVSHSHGDHFHAATLDALKKAGTLIVAPAAVYASLSATLKALTIPLSNGASTNVLGLTVDAIPAYNANHPKGAGNGYVVTLGGRRVYFAGDTGDIAEMKALTGIDVAFVCMNQPFTMTVAQAAGAIRAFRPRVVYPYHYRNSDGTLADLNALQRQVGADLGIEIRARKWY